MRVHMDTDMRGHTHAHAHPSSAQNTRSLDKSSLMTQAARHQEPRGRGRWGGRAGGYFVTRTALEEGDAATPHPPGRGALSGSSKPRPSQRHRTNLICVFCVPQVTPAPHRDPQALPSPVCRSLSAIFLEPGHRRYHPPPLTSALPTRTRRAVRRPSLGRARRLSHKRLPCWRGACRAPPLLARPCLYRATPASGHVGTTRDPSSDREFGSGRRGFSSPRVRMGPPASPDSSSSPPRPPCAQSHRCPLGRHQQRRMQQCTPKPACPSLRAESGEVGQCPSQRWQRRRSE